MLGAKTGYYAHPLTKGVGKPHKPALWPDHWAHPYPHPILGISLPPTWGASRQGNLLLVFTPPCCNRCPKKALSKFLNWPLINIY